jgi:hypothetical protein
VEPERPPAESEGPYSPRHALAESTPRWRLVLRGLTAVATLGVVVVVAVSLMSTESTDRTPSPAPSPSERGTACPALREAFDQRAAGTAASFLESARVAGRTGEDALQQDNVIFGAPERIAVELYLFVNEQDPEQGSPKIDRLLESARENCTTLGRWETVGD